MTAGRVVGRTREIAAVREVLDRGRVPAICGPPGIGRSTVAAAAVEGRPAVTGHALATLAFRPSLLFEIALRARAPGGDPMAVAGWVVRTIGARVLVGEDVHLAHPATLEVLGLLAGRVPMVLTVATGQPRTAAARSTLAGWGVNAAEPVELGPIPVEHATTLVRAANPALDAAAATRIAAEAGGIPAWLVAGARDPAGEGVRDVVDGFDVTGRTALAAAALLARPVPAELLGPGAGELVARGAAVRHATGDVSVVGPLARAALRRVPDADRRLLHAILADRLTADPGERARHLAAAGREDEAVAAAVEAAGNATAPEERAAHLLFAARQRPRPSLVADAVAALLDAGDLATARSWTDDLDRHDPDHNLLAARICRFADEPGPAVELVRRGLRTAPQGTATWRGLLLEALWLSVGRPSVVPAAEILAACADHEEEAAAGVAVSVLAALAGAESDIGALRSVDLDLLGPPESLHVGMQVVRALLRHGDGAGARDVADRIAAAATGSGHTTWATMARVERSWAAYLLDGDEDALAEMTELVEGLLTDSVRDRGRALLRLGLLDRDVTDTPGGAHDAGLWAAIAAEAALAADDLDEMVVPAATAGVPAADPVTALLAGPAWISAATRLGLPATDLADYPLLTEEAAALDPPDSTGLTSVADRWRGVAVRGVTRCLLAAGTPETRARAAELAIGAGLARWAARAGARPAAGAGPVTARERQVLQLVGAGCTTPMIARRLGLAASTVESHVKSAKLKLGATTRADAVARLA